jgi:alkanesulfonate monooxygenase SsuD/methylene tetrahydromethanopterin reductase-like flavin-dependent oxidoreductase (luciferase family)
MFERFTDRARRVVVLAQEEARMLNHNYIGTEHILLGLIHEGEGVAAKSLESLGISLEGVRSQVEEIIGSAKCAVFFIDEDQRVTWKDVGTKEDIADTLQAWFEGGAADGFNILPAWFPGAFDGFVDEVVPELQRRGLFRKHYTATTLRGHLGLDMPKNRFF